MTQEQLLRALSSQGQSRDLAQQALEVFDSFQLEQTVEVFTNFHESHRTVDRDFQKFCQEHGHTILRQLQVGGSFDHRSSVFLVLDADGLVKVYKELFSDEPALYERLSGLSFLPHCYGVVAIGEAYFMRFEVVYGQSLADYARPDHHLTVEEAGSVVGRIAEMLASLHERGVAYLDVRPENFKIDSGDLSLLDLGDSRVLEGGEVYTHVHDAAYVAPETVRRGVASPATDVWQLGVLWYKLLTGVHPFVDDEKNTGENWLDQVMCYGVRNSTALFNSQLLPPRLGNPRRELLSRMLSQNPVDRPTAQEVAKAFVLKSFYGFCHRDRAPVPEKNGTVLFPARMGIPHRGHIEFMARILELGFKLVVSLSASYVQTSLDPLPKWMVAKMVMKALAQKGFDTTQVRFIYTPLFENMAVQKMHFAMMPGGKEIVAVASGNPEVHELFVGRYPILDQRTVFGTEKDSYHTRSWGENLRCAVRENDLETFEDLIAPGATEILSFEEIRTYCRLSETPVIYSKGSAEWGNVYATVWCDGVQLACTRVNAYCGPEHTLVNTIPNLQMINPFERDAAVAVNGTTMRLQYERTTVDEKRNLLIHFQLLKV